jgi:hypothetical protein
MKANNQVSQNSMNIFTDLEANLAADTEGELLIQLHDYLGQTSQKLKGKLIESKDTIDSKHIQKLEQATDAAQKIICSVWKNFHPRKRIPI